MVRSDRAAGGEVAARDDDTLSGRLNTGTKQMTAAVTRPLDRSFWVSPNKAAEKQQQAAAAKRRKQQQPRSPLMSWLFPEPKQPRTLSEWLSQERPES